MRVVAGELRGRRIEAPAGDATRPTSDRVREAVFNALGSLGAVEGAEVVDLFAGSGAMGIEALSRGAAHVTFVERHPGALAVLRRNLAALGLEARSTVVAADAAAVPVPVPGRPAPDLALADPPYADDPWGSVLAGLAERGAPGLVLVAETATSRSWPAPWQLRRDRRYASTQVAILELGDPAGPPGGASTP